MRIPLERLIDGVIATLTNGVVPAVEERYARGQVWAVIDVLNNLRERIDWKQSLFDDEATSAINAVADVTRVLMEAGIDPTTPPIPSDATPAERVLAAREALAVSIQRVAAAPPEVAEKARPAIHNHLMMNALRDMQTYKVSLLTEISKG